MQALLHGVRLPLRRLSCRDRFRESAPLSRGLPCHGVICASADVSLPQLVAEKRPKDHRKSVGILLLNSRDQALVARRSDIANKGDDGVFSGTSPWQMPQGGVDKGEENEDAARRELREETGVTSVELLGRVPGWLCYQFPTDLLERWVAQGKGWKGKYRGQAQRWHIYRFTGEESEIDLMAHGEPEFTEWKWMPLEDIPGQIVPFKRAVYERVVEYARDTLRLGRAADEEGSSR